MATILVFDSGVGGLSISAAIVERLPEHQLIFASDNAAYPYGTKSEEELIPRVTKVTEKLIEETEADILVVACNTASTVVLPHLRKLFTIDVVGVVPAIKPAAALSVTKSIGVLATPATVRRQYTQDLIDTFAQDCNVEMIGSSELVELAEQKLHTGQVSITAVQDIIKPWLERSNAVDTIVLACTHFPLLKDELSQVCQIHQKAIQWVDSSEGISKRVEFLLSQKIYQTQADTSSKLASQNSAIFTAKITTNVVFEDTLNQLGITSIQNINI